MIRKFIASILILLGICSAIVSTYATVQPLSMAFSGQVKSIMVGMFIVVQVGVFFMAMAKHYIAKETPQHYILVNRISNILIIVSIVGTITFFEINRHYVQEHTKAVEDLFASIPFLASLSWYRWLVNLTVNFIFTWSVCVLLDVMAVKLPLIGFDLTMKIRHKRVHETILTMSWTILTHPARTLVRSRYEKLGYGENLTPNLTNAVKSKVKIIVKSPNEGVKSNILTQSTQELPADSEVKTSKDLTQDLPSRENELGQNEELSQSVKSWDKSIDLTKERLNRRLNSDELDLTQKVKDFICLNYELGQIVLTGELRRKFDLTESQWRKVKSSLDCIESVGTKLKRKEG